MTNRAPALALGQERGWGRVTYGRQTYLARIWNLVGFSGSSFGATRYR